MVLFTTAVMIAGCGPVQFCLSSSDPSYVFAVQFGFSAPLSSSAILTLESISPISILSQRWQQHVTQSLLVMILSLFLFFSLYLFLFLHLRNIFHSEIFFFSFFSLFIFCLKWGVLWALLTPLVPVCWHHVFVEFKIITMLIKLFSDSSVILSSRCHWDIRLKKLFFDMITDLKYWDLEICCK